MYQRGLSLASPTDSQQMDHVFIGKLLGSVMLGQVLKVLGGHTESVFDVAISSDGGKIVSGSRDKTVRVWSMETGQVRSCLPAGLPA